jgi:outer membrane murein-binding lipoprotein Lpp
MMKRIGELKAEVRKLTTERDANLVDAGSLFQENARLKAEVEHLLIFCNCTLIPSKELQAKVERLTKAGDAMASGLQGMAGERPKALADEWNDAKGVQS